jgi:hypothetical protein
MVILYAARHRLPVPALARCILALGIAATLAANVAHGAGHSGTVLRLVPAPTPDGAFGVHGYERRSRV